MSKKLPIVAVVVLVALGGAYKFVLAKPKAAEAKPKVEGTVYVLGKEFMVNLADGRFAKLTVALVLDPEDHSAAAGGGHEAAPKPPEGFGTMAQEAVVRDLITDALTNAHDNELIDRKGRAKLKKEIVESIHKHTDVEADDVLFTDVTVQ
jgi:flagellar basal body-associated protein FliL